MTELEFTSKPITQPAIEWTLSLDGRPRCRYCLLVFLTNVELTCHVAAAHVERTRVPPPPPEPREIAEAPQGCD